MTMTPLTENPAVLDPRKNLERAEKDALASIDFFRQQRIVDGRLQVGNKRFNLATIRRLEEKQLVRGRAPNISLTTGGGIALQRLRGDA
ncbi:hypothetical protein CFBP5507_07955 [Agrobacterium salinitolerans]|uniref:Uncharacterized protein n=1 Tax=Agrobacterium salinitolerans TaxID=1183413 RepID=A0A4Z1RCM0_9HYPH|nr:hypothetical protein [Agrobacterium salinitolerans]UYZ06195.1 hypothetical protein CFBP5507_07955 [Agrobacterium salinitolerans]